MCGIMGIFRREGGRPELSMDDIMRIRHRGPDAEGLYHDEHISLGHTRLSIIDLSPGGVQPMKYGDGRYVITYNGEIYNYLELKKELALRGFSFKSTSDTEVILAAYACWGPECVSRFRGMFAFALWDAYEKTLFLARDRCGEKPLIYFQDCDCFIFASEFKGLVPLLPERPGIELAAVDMFLHFQYTPEPFTLLKGVKKLPAGHTMTITPLMWEKEPVSYWNVEESALEHDGIGRGGDILHFIREGLEESIKLCLRSDVPVGVALSGGIDSGVIAAMAQKHYPEPMHAFAVGYPGRPPYDEREDARRLAESLGMIYHEMELPVVDFVNFFPRLVEILDEPIADIAAFGHYAVPKAAADCGIKVLLTGIGGDEVFWGYPWTSDAVSVNISETKFGKRTVHSLMRHFRYLFGNKLHWMKTTGYTARLPGNQMFFFPEGVDFWPTFDYKTQLYGESMKAVKKENPFRPTSIGHRERERIPAAIIRLLFETWLVGNCLNLGDRVSMAVGVETRLPFLDVRLIETVMALRRHTTDHKLGQKAWLRAAFKGILPDDVITRPKRGFQPPVTEWMAGVVNQYGKEMIEGNLFDEGIVEVKALIPWLDGDIKQDERRLFFLYKLVLLEQWIRWILNER